MSQVSFPQLTKWDLIFALPENREKDDDNDTETKGGSITSEVPITETDDQIPGWLHVVILWGTGVVIV